MCLFFFFLIKYFRAFLFFPLKNCCLLQNLCRGLVIAHSCLHCPTGGRHCLKTLGELLPPLNTKAVCVDLMGQGLALTFPSFLYSSIGFYLIPNKTSLSGLEVCMCSGLSWIVSDVVHLFSAACFSVPGGTSCIAQERISRFVRARVS